ncbi:hypothetical protein [Paenarthrobacter sp. YJN-5]|uniref:hypothetical protein n=1 Tax=Paenarthrobacter sp. YJN-5 TaxID=2735316 RepID=UPI001877FC84|nr:hypothetical protein [Paenarthrobacter sp. YJN-5]QOT16516.1 hypothetical protein HMI59_07790 [Paenarthrobacter sp. YJN-5]
MSKITKAHIIAARGRKQILEGQKKPVPAKIEKLAALSLAKFPSTQDRQSAISAVQQPAPGVGSTGRTNAAYRGRTTVRNAKAGEFINKALTRNSGNRKSVGTSMKPKG